MSIRSRLRQNQTLAVFWKTTCSLLAILASAILSIDPAAAGTETFELEHERVVMVDPGGYVIAQMSSSGIEWIPQGQSVLLWTEYFAAIMVPHGSVSVAGLQSGFFKSCPATGRKLVNIDTSSKGGFPTATWLQGCELTISGPSAGKPETDVMKLIQGRDVDLVVMKAFRFIPTDAQVDAALRILDETGQIRPK